MVTFSVFVSFIHVEPSWVGPCSQYSCYVYSFIHQPSLQIPANWPSAFKSHCISECMYRPTCM